MPSGTSSHSTPRRLGRRPVLDGVRGIAVLLVILTHTGVLAKGYIGVDVFFAISGFLITALLYEEWEGTGGISFSRFYRRRARRLLPALVILVGAVALVTVLLDPFSDGWSLGWRVITTLLFANNWVTAFGHQHQLGPLAPTWSLAQEEQFYLLWPLALWALLRLRVKPRFVIAFLVLAIVALLQAVPHVRHMLPSYNDYFSPLDRAAELLLGCAAAVAWRNGFVPRAIEWRFTAWVLAAGLVCLLFIPGLPRRWVYMGAAIVAVPLILNLLVERDSLMRRAIGSRPLCYLGTISYGLYLWHLLIDHLLTKYVPGRSPFFYTPIVMLTSVGIAGASWHLLESRILRRKSEAQSPRAQGVPISCGPHERAQPDPLRPSGRRQGNPSRPPAGRLSPAVHLDR